MKLKFSLTLAGLLVSLFVTANAYAQPAKPGGATLKVATRIVEPFVMEGNGKQLTGFSIDLWNSIGRELHVKTEYHVDDTVKSLLGTVQARKAEAGIAAISITSERQKTVDFSQPMFDSGLQIMVQDKASDGDNTPSILQVLGSPALRQSMLLVLVLILVPAHIVWLVERNKEGSLIENANYFPGIFKALWWAAGTLGAQADEMPRTGWGRLIAIFWMFTGIVFVAYFTAIITSTMTVSQLQGDINGPDDLPGKRVATVTGSTSAKYLEDRGIKVQDFPQFDKAAEAVTSGRADAVVFDSPVLLFYATNTGKNKSLVVGPIFRKENYGIAFPPGSPWRTKVNYVLLKLKESGEYDKIHDKWFGKPTDETQ